MAVRIPSRTFTLHVDWKGISHVPQDSGHHYELITPGTQMIRVTGYEVIGAAILLQNPVYYDSNKKQWNDEGKVKELIIPLSNVINVEVTD